MRTSSSGAAPLHTAHPSPHSTSLSTPPCTTPTISSVTGAAAAEASTDNEPMVNSGRDYSGHVRDIDVPVSGKLSLVQFLSVRYSHHNEAEWRHMISAGAVSVGPNTGDGQIQKDPASALKAHQRVVYRRAPWTEPPVPGIDQLNGDSCC